MASSCKIYTTGLMESAEATLSTGTAATGHPVDDCLDFNPDTYFTGSDTSNQIIDIDLGAVQEVDEVGAWVHNYNDVIGINTISITFYSDDNDNGSYSAVTQEGQFIISDDSEDFPLKIGVLSSAVSKRYWRIVLAVSGGVWKPEISQLFFLNERSVSIGNTLPEAESDKFPNLVIDGPGGRRFPMGVGSQVLTSFDRHWVINGDTDMDALRNAFRDSYGNRLPVILNEGSDYYYVFIENVEFNRVSLKYQLYDISLRFAPIPYVPDGSTY